MQCVYGRRHVHDRRQDRLHRNDGHRVQSRPVCGRHILLRFGERPGVSDVCGRRHVHGRREYRLHQNGGHRVPCCVRGRHNFFGLGKRPLCGVHGCLYMSRRREDRLHRNDGHGVH